jgi:hypothetical protein
MLPNKQATQEAFEIFSENLRPGALPHLQKKIHFSRWYPERLSLQSLKTSYNISISCDQRSASLGVRYTMKPTGH